MHPKVTYNWTIKRHMHTAWSTARQLYGKGAATRGLNSVLRPKSKELGSSMNPPQPNLTSTASGERGMTMVAGTVNMETVMKDYPHPDKNPSTWTIEELSAVRCLQLFPGTTKIKTKGIVEHASTLYKDPFVKTQEDRDQIAQNFIIFDAVEANFIQIMSEKGPIPKHSETYHKTIILMHALSITLWGYMFVWTAAMTCGF